MTGEPIHVVPDGEDWLVRRQGKPDPIGRYDTQAEAEKAGRDRAKGEHSESGLPGRTGQTRERDSNGTPPPPRRGGRPRKAAPPAGGVRAGRTPPGVPCPAASGSQTGILNQWLSTS